MPRTRPLAALPILLLAACGAPEPGTPSDASSDEPVASGTEHASVSGTLRGADGEAVAGASVCVAGAADEACVFSDEDGAYALRVPTGSPYLSLEIDAEDHEPTLVPVHLRDSHRALDVQLPRAGFGFVDDEGAFGTVLLRATIYRGVHEGPVAGGTYSGPHPVVYAPRVGRDSADTLGPRGGAWVLGAAPGTEPYTLSLARHELLCNPVAGWPIDDDGASIALPVVPGRVTLGIQVCLAAPDRRPDFDESPEVGDLRTELPGDEPIEIFTT